MKICTNCNIQYSLEEFYRDSSHLDGYRSSCKKCSEQQKKIRRSKINNPISVNIKECRTCKYTKTADRFTKDKNNSDGLCTQCKNCRSLNSKKFYKANKIIIKQRTLQYYKEKKEIIISKRREYRRNKEKTDVFFKLKRRLRNRLYYALKRTTWEKNTHFSEYIGCTKEELIEYLQSKFKQDMNWDNYGIIWDIDHLLPLSSAKTEKRMYELCHYTNLNPEYCHINRVLKRDKLPENISWQKLQRDRLLPDDIKRGMPLNLKVSDFTLAHEKITKEHRDFIERYEWLGTCGFGVRHVFTARHNGLLGGVVMIAEPNSYQFAKELEALIQRGACASWTPINLGSKLVSFSCKWMARNTTKRIFVAYSDPEAGEIGTIYQAANFDYLGQTFGSDYQYQLPNGKLVGTRHFTRTSSMKKWAKELGIEWKSEWLSEGGFQIRKNIPEDIKQKLDEYAKMKYEGLEKIKKQPKGKYIRLENHGKQKVKKTWESLPFPKRNI